MERLASEERFEEASETRDRLRALVAALGRGRQERWFLQAGRLEILVEGSRLAFRSGALERRGDERGYELPVSFEAWDEVRAVLGWLRGKTARVLAADIPPAETVAGGATLARLRKRMEGSRGG
jgi:hypothetical protein